MKIEQRRKIWLMLAIFGSTVPNYFFMRHYLQQGFSLPNFWHHAVINDIAQGATIDLCTMIVIFWIWAGFVLQRKGRLSELWLYIVLAIGLGLSCAFPVFLYRHDQEL